MDREQKKFIAEHPKSKALFERAQKSLLAGVPMNWMMKWAGAFPPFVREAQGAHFFDVTVLTFVCDTKPRSAAHFAGIRRARVLSSLPIERKNLPWSGPRLG